MVLTRHIARKAVKMIEYVSTRNPSIRVRSSKAILDGQAEGGGLYVPSDLDKIRADYHEIIKGDFRSMAKAVWNIFFDDYGEELIDKLVERSYKNKFTSEDITPVVKTHSSTGSISHPDNPLSNFSFSYIQYENRLQPHQLS